MSIGRESCPIFRFKAVLTGTSGISEGKMRKTVYAIIFAGVLFTILLAPSVAQDEEIPKKIPWSEQTEQCLDCHRAVTPGIVEDWLVSAHAKVSPSEAMNRGELEMKVSSPSIPSALTAVAVGCFECHGLNPENHQDNFEHFDNRINVIVSPADCATCHRDEREQYTKSKKANALDNLKKNTVFLALVETILGQKEVDEIEIRPLLSTEESKDETCYACHGTPVEVRGMLTIETDFGPVEVPELYRWPNQGVGRVNPDGSLGSCTSCHPRHSFSIEIARKPETCSQCHLEPDTPAWNVYRESKHGNIYLSHGDDWNWTNVPWVIGQDFKAPTCASCHNSLLTDTEGEIIAPRSHDFGNRLWIRIFGLIYSHPQPQSGQTHTLINADGLPLPITFQGLPAAQGLLTGAEQEERFDRMQTVCLSCHSSLWTGNHFRKFKASVEEADKMVWAATELVVNAWEEGLAGQRNPFDEAIEHKWIEQWLFFANSVRYASAMNGPDYATFKNGWWKMSKNLQEMREAILLKRLTKK